MRQVFENWVAHRLARGDAEVAKALLEQSSSGEYCAYITRGAWEAWQDQEGQVESLALQIENLKAQAIQHVVEKASRYKLEWCSGRLPPVGIRCMLVRPGVGGHARPSEVYIVGHHMGNAVYFDGEEYDATQAKYFTPLPRPAEESRDA